MQVNVSKIKQFWLELQQYTAQKMKFSIKDFLSKYEQIRIFLQIWSHLLERSFMENFIFCVVITAYYLKKKTENASWSVTLWQDWQNTCKLVGKALI